MPSTFQTPHREKLCSLHQPPLRGATRLHPQDEKGVPAKNAVTFDDHSEDDHSHEIIKYTLECRPEHGEWELRYRHNGQLIVEIFSDRGAALVRTVALPRTSSPDIMKYMIDRRIISISEQPLIQPIQERGNRSDAPCVPCVPIAAANVQATQTFGAAR
jgi:hypothetical protein